MLDSASTHQDTIPSGGQLGFLRRVSEDDQFRSLLEADPESALAQYGLQVDTDQIPSHVQLPSPDVLEKSLVKYEFSILEALARMKWLGLFN